MWAYILLIYIFSTPARVVKTVQPWVPDNLGNVEATSSISTPFHKNFMSVFFLSFMYRSCLFQVCFPLAFVSVLCL